MVRKLVCPKFRYHQLRPLLIIYVRLPFYWETRTIFLLFLALPQTQVSKTDTNVLCSQVLTVILLGIYLHLQNISRAVLPTERS